MEEPLRWEPGNWQERRRMVRLLSVWAIPYCLLLFVLPKTQIQGLILCLCRLNTKEKFSAWEDLQEGLQKEKEGLRIQNPDFALVWPCASSSISWGLSCWSLCKYNIVLCWRWSTMRWPVWLLLLRLYLWYTFQQYHFGSWCSTVNGEFIV